MLYLMLYGGSAMATLIICIYLCFRRSNAIDPDITPPVALRRWAAAFFGVAFLSHIWWFLFFLYSNDIHSLSFWLVSSFEASALLTTISGMLFSMFQDRKRSIWPVVAGAIPYVVLLLLHIVYPNSYSIYIAIAYFLSFYVLFTLYTVLAVRQYRRWLHDNYADLEHKEVWVSHVLIIILLLLIISEGFNTGNIIISFLEQAIGFVIFGLLLWRVETLPQLVENNAGEHAGIPLDPETAQLIGLPFATEGTQEPGIPTQAHQPSAIPSNIEQLLYEHCVVTKLYLQHDLTLLQLAQAIGTNRLYLSQYFSSHNTTYNAYINNLRINHFLSIYRQSADAGQPITAQQLAFDSGYRSYSTFSLAFKQRTGQSVTAWMREAATQ